MKLLPLILTNLICMGVAIGAYDMIKSDSATASNEGGDVNLIDGSELAARVAKLEQASPNGPLLTGPDAPTISEDRIAEIVRAQLKDSGSVASDGTSVSVERPKVEVKADDYQVEAFEEMMNKVEAKRRVERDERRQKDMAERMSKRLDRLELGLNDNQKSEIMKIHDDYRKKIRDTFTKMRESGAGREEYREVMTPLREELTKSVENVVPGDDAQKVVQALGGGGMRGGFDRGARANRRGFGGGGGR